MPADDGTQVFTASRGLADDLCGARSGAAPSRRTYRCRECKAPARLSDLNDAMLCAECGEPCEASDFNPSAEYLRRWESTWSV